MYPKKWMISFHFHRNDHYIDGIPVKDNTTADSCKFDDLSLYSILVDPGAVSRVGINGGEGFRERAREPLGCYQ